MKIHEDDFWKNYKPQKNELVDDAPFNGCMYETYGEELEYVQRWNRQFETTVWTVLDVDGELIIGAGMSFVNRMGYIITEKPWNSLDDEVLDA